ncbi:hypothetical protein ACIA5G_39975 [Amycolatopsis sp. NPDC051758]|uniref:hypothetical protein n=1 Tax=Amycolatopsis sp. NPDC051758 TaxID=3363935 RepID=UPI00379384EB
MTSSTITRTVRSRRTPFAANPNRFCNACVMELSRTEQAQSRELKGRCERCAEIEAPSLRSFSPATVAAAERIEERARLTSLGLDPETGDSRRCGSCDTNISALPGAEYCSGTCQADAAEQAAPVATAVKTAEPKPLPSDVRIAVLWSIREGLTDHEIRVGLNSAWNLREGNRFTPDAVAAAARAWFEDYNRETFKRGERNTKVLRTLNAVRRLVEG